MEGTMKQRVWILIFAAMAASADAAEYWSSCNSCSEPQAQRAALRTVEGAMIGRHDAYVVDFDRETVRKYSVWREYDPEFRAWESSLWALATEAHVAHEFAQLVSAMKNDVAALESGKDIPHDVVGSAYDLMHSSINRQRVASYIFSHMSFWESIGAPVFVPLSLLRKVVDLNLTISVIFADGSTAQFVLTGVDGSLGELEYVFELVDGSARDADGNMIPRSSVEAAPFEGTFSSTQAAQRMVNFIQAWYVVSSGPVIQCSSKQVGNNIIVTCKRS
jgi:hypothetical protein